MRAGEFELAIVDSTLLPLPEVSAPGKSYAVAQPDQEFEVLFKCSRMAPNTVYNVYLSVDGRDVGHHKSSRDSDGTPTYRGFRFATPRQDASKAVTSVSNFTEGKLVCEVWEAQLGGMSGYSSNKYTVPDATVAALPEGKKFFMGPSLTTAAGAAKTGQKFMKETYDKVGDAPVARLELHYETAATLLLRVVLNPDANPEHKRIVDACTGGGRQQQQQRQDRGEAAGHAEGSGDKRPIKQERQPAEQQQEQRQQEQQQQAGRGELAEIDLTGAAPWRPRPRDPLLAAKRAGKELVCDLTGEEEEPRWRESKRRAITLN